MTPFLNGTIKNKATSNNKDILINWQHIMLVEQNDTSVGITLTMTTGKKIPIDASFEVFRKLLLEYTLTLDDCHRVITCSSKEHDWEMVDRS